MLQKAGQTIIRDGRLSGFTALGISGRGIGK
jgi:hypothetical protein